MTRRPGRWMGLTVTAHRHPLGEERRDGAPAAESLSSTPDLGTDDELSLAATTIHEQRAPTSTGPPQCIQMVAEGNSPDYEALRALADARSKDVRVRTENYDAFWDVGDAEKKSRRHPLLPGPGLRCGRICITLDFRRLK